MSDLHTLEYLMKNGRHEGERITRVPVSYLQLMVNQNHRESHMARAELKRRGTVVPEMEISSHAINRASLRIMHVFGKRDDKKEGLHSWMLREAGVAMILGTKRGDKYSYHGIKWAIVTDGVWPVVLSVMERGKVYDD